MSSTKNKLNSTSSSIVAKANGSTRSNQKGFVSTDENFKQKGNSSGFSFIKGGGGGGGLSSVETNANTTEYSTFSSNIGRGKGGGKHSIERKQQRLS